MDGWDAAAGPVVVCFGVQKKSLGSNAAGYAAVVRGAPAPTAYFCWNVCICVFLSWLQLSSQLSVCKVGSER